MFGYDSKPSRVYGGYTCTIVENEEGLMEQLRLADEYRRELIRNERRRIFRVRDLIRERHPNVATLEAAVNEALEALDAAKADVKKANQKARSQAAPPESRAAVKAARDRLKEAKAAWKAARKTAYADPATQEGIQAIDAMARDQVKTLRADTLLHWGSKAVVEQACDRAFRDARKTGLPPRYRDQPDVGGLAIQIQKGMDWTEALMCQDSRFRLVVEPVQRPADVASKRSGESIVTAWFRIGSADADGMPTRRGSQRPIWAKVRFRLFRSPPPDARIKWVRLHRTKVGPVYQWELQFVLEREAGWDRDDRAEGGLCGIDLGWRMVADGLRVAYLAADDGHEESLVIPHERLSAWKQVDDLRSTRDRHFDEFLPRLVAWAKKHASILPGWWAERCDHLAQWKSHERLREVIEAWRGDRFAGDEAIFNAAETWRKRDKHLHHWQEALRLKTIRWRDLHYRQWVGKVAKLYRVVVTEDTDFARLRERPGEDVPADDPSRDAARASGMARVASPARLRDFLERKVVQVVRHDAKDTTRACNSCGHVNKFDDTSALVLTCLNPECGVTWDQDANAARNLRDAHDQIARAAVVV